MQSHEISPEITNFIRCFIAGEELCVRKSWVRGIRNISELNIAIRSQFQIGYMQTETGPCPVLSLDKHIKQTQNCNYESKKILIFLVPGGHFGIAVDSVDNIFEVSVNKIFQLPIILGDEFLSLFNEAILHNSHLILSLSPPSIFDTYISNSKAEFDNQYLYDLNYSNTILPNLNYKQKKIISFKICDQESIIYALSLTQVSQILQLSDITKIPRAKKFIIGVIEWRGIILPIIDFSLLINNKETSLPKEGRLLVIRLVTLPLYIGIIIHKHIIIQSFPIMNKLHESCYSKNPETVYYQCQLANQTFIIPNLDKMILDW